MALRESDYATMRGHPEPPSGAFERWRTIYASACLRAGGQPNAGRWLVEWLRDAGFETAGSIAYSASAVVYNDNNARSACARAEWGQANADACAGPSALSQQVKTIAAAAAAAANDSIDSINNIKTNMRASFLPIY